MSDPGATRVRTLRRRLLQPLWSALDAHVLPAPGALLAVSGGPDSRALLEAVARWPRRFDGVIEVACMDHRTRAESAGEAAAVVARARALGFDGAVLVVDGAARGEGALRDLRYAALFAHAAQRGLAAVVVAHHAGDAAENALLSWLGNGGGALRSRPALVRPFLGLTRSDLRMALTACGVDDEFADPDARSARSRVRARVLGALAAERGDVEVRLAALNERAGDDDDALMAEARRLVSVVPGGAVLAWSPHKAVLRRMIRIALGAAAADPRDSARAVEVAVALMQTVRAGHVDAAGASVDVAADGTARVTVRVAVRAPPTHDGRTEPRLSAVGSRIPGDDGGPVRMVTE